MPRSEPQEELPAAPEPVAITLRALNATFALTDHRVKVVTGRRTIFDLPYDGIRRIQFDLERSHPATLVIVPNHPKQEPQVLAIAPDAYEAVCRALVTIGLHLAEIDD